MKEINLIKIIEEIGPTQHFTDSIYKALQNVNEFKNLSLDARGEICIEIVKLFDEYI